MKLKKEQLVEIISEEIEQVIDEVGRGIPVGGGEALTCAEAGAKAGAAYISPFVGRVEDNSFDGVALIKEIAAIYRKQYITKTQVLAASLRDVHSVSRCYADGADIVTMPPAVFEKMYKHILTDKGLEQFDIDYAESVKE